MFKHVLSALVVTGLLASGAAFAAESSAQSGPASTPAQAQTPAPTAAAAPAVPSPVKSAEATKATKATHQKAAHPHVASKVKAEQTSEVKSVPAKTSTAVPEKAN